jgi:hypothetical protein
VNAELFSEPSRTERQYRRDMEAAQVQAFYSGTNQQVRRYFEKLFPTADWRRAQVALVEWTKMAKVPPWVKHDIGGVWSLEQCWRLSASVSEFLKFLDDVHAKKIPTPEWAKNLPPPSPPKPPHSC